MTVDVQQAATSCVGKQQNSANTSKTFQLTISLKNVEDGANNVTFKQDGSRFPTSQRTIKLITNSKYQIVLSSKPAQEFTSLHLAGSDLDLIPEKGQGIGSYSAIWDTAGIEPTRRGGRQDILFVLEGQNQTLTQKLQTKFYGKQDSHGIIGHRLEALVWNCEINLNGQINVNDEKIL
uniref:CB1 cannabinoid receptor-interacting protein 1 n=1 Tax=Meloidogyne incognita TaxID=6306 RepID=A0A914KH13_MELIC